MNHYEKLCLIAIHEQDNRITMDKNAADYLIKNQMIIRTNQSEPSHIVSATDYQITEYGKKVLQCLES